MDTLDLYLSTVCCQINVVEKVIPLRSILLSNIQVVVGDIVFSRYGDLKPASPVGRMLASVWMLIGMIVITTFTATITTALGFESSEDTEIRGYKVRNVR